MTMDQSQPFVFLQRTGWQGVYYALPPMPDQCPYVPFMSEVLPLSYALSPPAGGLDASPLLMLAHAAGAAQEQTRQVSLLNPYVPVQETAESLRPHEDPLDTMLGSIGGFVLEALGWYQSGVIPNTDVDRLARRVVRYMLSVCEYYANNKVVPPGETEIQLTSQPYSDTESSTESEGEDQVSTASPSSTQSMDDGFINVCLSPSISPNSFESGDSAATTSSTRTFTRGTSEWPNESSSCTCDGLPSRHAAGVNNSD
ncbi:hypothetical protein F5Y06DRAFT_305442 [Hypoxylon sp. FL0890]|nr:hypothetical protein F5Y06DRAFT_305442 [Hypoxylon sp. FL0890]